MPLAAAVVLHCPIEDESRLADFVDECLRDGVLLVAAIGPGSRRAERLIDNLIIGDGSDPDRFFCTSSHPYQSLDQVLDFAFYSVEEDGGSVQQLRL